MGVVEFRNTGLEGPARRVAERQRRYSPPETHQRGSERECVNAPRVSVVGQDRATAPEAITAGSFFHRELQAVIVGVDVRRRLSDLPEAHIRPPQISSHGTAGNESRRVDVHILQNVTAMGAHIGTPGQPVRQQLMFDCQIPVIGGRGFELLSWSEGNDGNRAGKRRTRGRRRVGRERVRLVAERLVERSRRLCSVNLNSTERVAVRHHGREIGHLPGVVEHAGSTAQTGPAIAEDVPGESKTGRKVIEIRGSSVFGSGVAELRETTSPPENS